MKTIKLTGRVLRPRTAETPSRAFLGLQHLPLHLSETFTSHSQGDQGWTFMFLIPQTQAAIGSLAIKHPGLLSSCLLFHEVLQEPQG